MMSRTQATKRRGPLLLVLVLIVLVVRLDGERLLGDGGLGLVVGRGHGRLLVGRRALVLGILVRFAREPEEVALDVGALLRFGGTVMAGERDALRVLGALERLADGDPRVLLIVAHDRHDVLVARLDEVEQPAAALRPQAPDDLSVPPRDSHR